MQGNSLRGYLLAGLGGACWGTLGVVVKQFYAMGFASLQVASLRLGGGGLLLSLVLVIIKPGLLKVRWRDIPFLFIYALTSVALFNLCYFTSMQYGTVTMAVMLLYTAPAFLVVLAFFIYRESITPVKLAALFLTLVGCALVVKAYQVANLSVNKTAILSGLTLVFFTAYLVYSGKRPYKIMIHGR
ncbi:MAG TPA: DMT family transporter [Firmicutes bacterium]|jgi:drug/metabolite transporter (DMT)-like permease|nr:DMT family transporter [Bacillota bacterium]